MRHVFLGIAILSAGAAAQPSLDGKARFDGESWQLVEKFPEPTHVTKASLRRAASIIFARKATADDADLIYELASGKPVAVTVEGSTVELPGLQGELLWIAQLMSAVPNLKTLYKTPGEPFLAFIELSRWGEKAKDRIVTFLANELEIAWANSTMTNDYGPWRAEFGGIVVALNSVADLQVREEGKLLLKAGVEQVVARCKQKGGPPPHAYLYNFALSDAKGQSSPKPQAPLIFP